MSTRSGPVLSPEPSTVLKPQTGEDIPRPAVTDLSRPFWAACHESRLLYQYFPASGQAQFPPSPVCRVSGSREFEWRESQGRGLLYSWTVVWRPQTPAYQVPYAPAIVELAEGYRMVSAVVDCTTGDLAVGMPVEVVFHEVCEGFVLPYFRPAREVAR